MRAIVGAVVMASVLVLYLWLAAYQGYVMITTGIPVAVVMGVALIVLPVVGAWALWREIAFGFNSTRLVRIIESEGALPGQKLPQRPSGKPLRVDADKAFPEYAAAAEAEPENWRVWCRLGLAYDASGDRKRARAAIRNAISLNKTNPA
jgi:tetratricopeptide (TPR) repeat protein